MDLIKLIKEFLGFTLFALIIGCAGVSNTTREIPCWMSEGASCIMDSQKRYIYGIGKNDLHATGNAAFVLSVNYADEDARRNPEQKSRSECGWSNYIWRDERLFIR